jgi:tRNA (guanine-N7-)-methyltransferase
VDVVADMLSNAGFDAVNLFFPDPWPKKRHHKRRIVQPDFVASVARILKPGGLFHVATDWADYAGEIETLMAATPCFAPLGPDGVDTALAYRPPTKFEARGLGLGHEIADFFYTRRPEPTASDPLGRG